MPLCPSCNSDVAQDDLHCRQCGRSLADTNTAVVTPVLDRPLRDLPGMIVKGIGIAIGALAILTFTLADIGALRPIIERTHQFIPFIDDPVCGDIHSWYSSVEDDHKSLDNEMSIIDGKTQPTASDFALLSREMEDHRKFLIDSDPPDEALKLRSMYLENTDYLISASASIQSGDREAALASLDEGDRISVMIDEETTRINEKCGWASRPTSNEPLFRHSSNITGSGSD